MIKKRIEFDNEFNNFMKAKIKFQRLFYVMSNLAFKFSDALICTLSKINKASD